MAWEATWTALETTLGRSLLLLPTCSLTSSLFPLSSAFAVILLILVPSMNYALDHQVEFHKNMFLIFIPFVMLLQLFIFLSNVYSLGGWFFEYQVLEIASSAVVSLSSILVGVGDLRIHFMTNTAEEVSADEGTQVEYEGHFLISGITWSVITGLVMFPSCSYYLMVGKRSLANRKKISVKRVRRLIYSSFPQAIFSAVVALLYFVAESVGCILHEGDSRYCIDVISSNTSFSFVFLAGLFHKSFVEVNPRSVLANQWLVGRYYTCPAI